MKPVSLLAALIAPALPWLASPVRAHPHVWITARAEIAYAPDGRVTAVSHVWTFDPAYSAYVTQGLDKDNDGRLSPDELQELAKVNTESLVEFDYFTVLKANGVKQTMAPPRDYGMTFADGKATLSFSLPLKTPALANKALTLEIYDPTYFVSFGMAEGADAVRLSGAPKGCATTIMRPKPIEAAQQQRLSEAFYEALTAASGYGAQFSNRAIIACP